jgi:hypothetical protein
VGQEVAQEADQEEKRLAEKEAQQEKTRLEEKQLELYTVSGKLELKVKGMFGDSWPQVEFALDPRGKSMQNKPGGLGSGVFEAKHTIIRLEKIEPRPGKRQNRFNLHVASGKTLELAALSGADFTSWVNAAGFCLNQER